MRVPQFLGIAMHSSPHLWKHFVTPVPDPARHTPEQVSVPLTQLKPVSHVSLAVKKTISKVCLTRKHLLLPDSALVIFNKEAVTAETP
jgi:hypothetical protein